MSPRAAVKQIVKRYEDIFAETNEARSLGNSQSSGGAHAVTSDKNRFKGMYKDLEKAEALYIPALKLEDNSL